MPEARADQRWTGWAALAAVFVLFVLIEGVGQHLRRSDCEGPPLTVTPAAAPAGATVVVSAGPTNCHSATGKTVRVTFPHIPAPGATSMVTTTAMAPNGAFAVPMVIPAGTPPGRLFVLVSAGQARCRDTGSCASGPVVAIDVLPR